MVPPGAMALARMPLSRYITATDLVSPAIACLEAAPAALPRSDASEAVLTMAPQVADHRAGGASGGLDLGDDGLGALGVDVRDQDLGALVGSS